MPDNQVSVLADYVLQSDNEVRRIVEQMLQQLANELGGQQQLVRQAVLNYRQGIPSNPTTDEFYDLVSFLEKMTCNFIDNRIELSVLSNEKLDAWRKREDAPKGLARRNCMFLMIDSFLEHGMLNGVGRVHDFLASPGGDSLLEGDWLIKEGEFIAT